MADNLLVKATERPSYGWVDSRAIWAGDMKPGEANFYWFLKNAVSCCCGLTGPIVQWKNAPLSRE